MPYKPSTNQRPVREAGFPQKTSSTTKGYCTKTNDE